MWDSKKGKKGLRTEEDWRRRVVEKDSKGTSK